MSWVFPGRPEVFAKLFRSVSIFIKDDLPTLDRPIKAYSGKGSLGHLATSVLLITKFADLIFTVKVQDQLKKDVWSFGLRSICAEVFFFGNC